MPEKNNGAMKIEAYGDLRFVRLSDGRTLADTLPDVRDMQTVALAVAEMARLHAAARLSVEHGPVRRRCGNCEFFRFDPVANAASQERFGDDMPVTGTCEWVVPPALQQVATGSNQVSASDGCGCHSIALTE